MRTLQQPLTRKCRRGKVGASDGRVIDIEQNIAVVVSHDLTHGNEALYNAMSAVPRASIEFGVLRRRYRSRAGGFPGLVIVMTVWKLVSYPKISLIASCCVLG